MLTDCFGRRLSTSSVMALHLTLVVNIYNLMIIWLLHDPIVQLFRNTFEKPLIIIMAETIVTIFVIIFSTKHNETLACFNIKYWIYGIAIIILALDILCTVKTANHMVRSHTSFKNSQNRAISQSEWKPLERNLYHGIVSTLGVNLVFKIYALWKVIRLDRKHGTEVDDELMNNNDAEMNSLRGSTLLLSPPSYDQCMTPPPPYRDVQK